MTGGKSLQDDAEHVNSRLGRKRPRVLRALLIAFLVVPLVGTPVTGPSTTRGDQLSDAYAKQKALQQQIADQKALLASLQNAQAATAAAISSTSAKLNGINTDLASVTAAVKEATAQLAIATAKYYGLVQQVRLLNEQLLWLQATADQKAAELKVRQDSLAQRLSAAYLDSSVPLLAQLLGSGSLNDALVTISYNLSAGNQDRELAQQIAADQATLASLESSVSLMQSQAQSLRDAAEASREDLAAQRQTLQADQAKLQELQAQTKALMAQQQAAYAKYSANAAATASALANSQKAEAALKTLIDKLVAQQSSGYGIPSQYSGSLIWPMAGVVTQEFGCTGVIWEPPLGSCAHFHRGIDIANSLGTHIHAAGAGTVVYAGCGYDLYGACEVVIAHSSNLLTWYAHVEDIFPVHAGQHVVQGQLIAYEGCTGLCTGPHLHWAVELNGNWVNPRLFL